MLSLFKISGAVGFHEILDSLAEGFMVFDAAGQVVFVNRAALAQFGLNSKDELLSRSEELRQRIHVYDLDGMPVAQEHLPMYRALRGEEFVGLELHIVDERSGRDWYGSYSGTYVMKDGVLDRAVIITRDVTELKRAERELARRTRELSNLVGDIESFSYSLAHDLRGPLRAVISYAEILQDDYPQNFSGEPEVLLERIRQSGLRMANILDAVLNLTVIARKRPQTTLFDLTALVDECASEIIERSDLAVTFKCTTDAWVHADRDLLRIALTNLLENAVKYRSRERPLAITFGENEARGAREFYIADNGVGFAAEDARSRLFKPFSRLGDVPHVEGCGIGLAIVKRVIEHHDGTVRAESDPGKGATFFFTLGRPVHAPRSPRARSQD